VTRRKSKSISENTLRSAKPRLLIVARPIKGGLPNGYRMYISDVDLGWDELVREGFDPEHSPLGPVFWRIVRRAGEGYYLSTFMASRDGVLQAWGVAGLAYCDPITGLAPARVETFTALFASSEIETPQKRCTDEAIP
jgi:hypothetical protein